MANMKKALALGLSLAMVATSVPANVQPVQAAAKKQPTAATKMTFSKTSVSVKEAAKTGTIKIKLNKKATKKVTINVKSNSTAIAKVSKAKVVVKKGKKASATFTVTGVKAGTTKVKASFKNKKGKTITKTMKVTVTAAAKPTVTPTTKPTTTPTVTPTTEPTPTEEPSIQDESGVVVSGDGFAEGETVPGTIGVVAKTGKLIGAYNGIMTDLSYQWYCAETVDGQYLDASGYSSYAGMRGAAPTTLDDTMLTELADNDRPYVYCVASGQRDGKETSYTSGKVFIGDSVATDPAYVSTEKNYQKAVAGDAKTVVLTGDIQFKEETEIPAGITVDINGTDVSGTIATNKGTITNTKTAKAVTATDSTTNNWYLIQAGSITGLTTNEGTITVPAKATIAFGNDLENKGTIETAASKEADADDQGVDKNCGHIFMTATAANTTYATAFAGGFDIVNKGTIKNGGYMYFNGAGYVQNTAKGALTNDGEVFVEADEHTLVNDENFTNNGTIITGSTNGLVNLVLVTNTLGGTFKAAGNIASATIPVKDGLTTTVDLNGNDLASTAITVTGAANFTLINGSATAKSSVNGDNGKNPITVRTVSGKTATITIGKNVWVGEGATGTTAVDDKSTIYVNGPGSAKITVEKDAKLNTSKNAKNAAAGYSANGFATNEYAIAAAEGTYKNVTVNDLAGYGDKWKLDDTATPEIYYWTSAGASFINELPTSGTYGKVQTIDESALKVKTSEGIELSMKDALAQKAVSAASKVSFKATRQSDGKQGTITADADDYMTITSPASNKLGEELAKLDAGVWDIRIVDADDEFTPCAWTYTQNAKQIADGDFILTTGLTNTGTIASTTSDKFIFTEGANAGLFCADGEIAGNSQSAGTKDNIDALSLAVTYDGAATATTIGTTLATSGSGTNDRGVTATVKNMTTLSGNGTFTATITCKGNYTGTVTISGKVSDLTNTATRLDNNNLFVVTYN